MIEENEEEFEEFDNSIDFNGLKIEKDLFIDIEALMQDYELGDQIGIPEERLARYLTLCLPIINQYVNHEYSKIEEDDYSKRIDSYIDNCLSNMELLLQDLDDEEDIPNGAGN